MNHFASPDFWECYNRLPIRIRDLADKNFTLLKENPKHPSVHLKKVGKFWSVRIGIRHRALALEMDQGLIWFWVGNHTEYERLIQS